MIDDFSAQVFAVLLEQEKVRKIQDQNRLELKIETARLMGQIEAIKEFQAYMEAYLGTLKILFELTKGTGDKNV